MSTAARWTLVAFIAVLGVVVALLTTLGGDPAQTAGGDPGDPGATTDGGPAPTAPPVGAPPAEEPLTTAEADARQAVGFPDCRDSAARATTAGPLSGFMVRCMDDGSTTTLGKIQSETPMLVNLWAYWCEPCRRELPAIQAAQATLGDKLRVVLSHTDPSETKGLDTLAALGIDELVSVSDQEEELPGILNAPPVLPLTVLVRADGSVARVLIEPMDSEQEVLDAVAEHLGVTA